MIRDSYDTTLILWPATPLAASVADELRGIGVPLAEPEATPGWLTAQRTEDGQLVLEISREQLHGLTDLEAVLATLRLAGVSYVAWDAKQAEIAGIARSYDPESRVEREFTVMPDGEPVLTLSDLNEFEGRYGTAEGLLEGVQAWLRLPLPQNLSQVDGFTIVIEPEDVRARIAQALEDAEWPSVAEDVRDGVDLDTVICRIGEAMDPEEAREPIEIIERQTVAVKGGDGS